jgi:hypothetical protein
MLMLIKSSINVIRYADVEAFVFAGEDVNEEHCFICVDSNSLQDIRGFFAYGRYATFGSE